MTRRPLTLAAAATALLAAPGTATAAPLAGLTTITVGGPSASALGKAGGKLSASGGAGYAAGRLLLPIASGTLAASATVEQSGTVVITRKAQGRKRTATLTGLRVELGSKGRTVSAKINGKRVPFLSLDLRKDEYTVTPATSVVVVSGARASLTAAAAKAIAKRLGVKKIRTGVFGVLATNGGKPGAVTTPSIPTTSPSAPATGAPSVPSAPSTVFPDPGALARPASAVEVTSSAYTWNVRESFVRYINTEQAPAVTGGAAAGAAAVRPGTSNALVYDYAFTPAGGWYDAASGQARLLFKGTVSFNFPAHGISFDVTDPEVQLTGETSRVVATFAGRMDTPYAGRNVLVDLEPGAPVVSGTTRSWASIPGTVPAASTQSIFGGFYAAGDPFGSIALSLTPAS